MNYAVIKTGGKQYKVTPGMELMVESLGKTQGSIEFSEVLLYVEDGKTTIGTPLVSGVKIPATILGDVKGPKIHVSKFLAKSRYRRKTGYRQSLSRVKVGEFGKTEMKEEQIKESAPKKEAVKKTSKRS